MRSAVVDPGTYLAARREIFHCTQKRALPTSFKFSTGYVKLGVSDLVIKKLIANLP